MSYLTLAEFKAALGITGNEQDAVLARSLSSATSLVNGYLRWDPTDTNDRHYTTTVECGKRGVKLPLYPVLEVKSVTDNGRAVVGGDGYPDGWWVDKTHGFIEDVILTPDNRGRYSRMTVVYTAGYSPVPQELKDVVQNIAGGIFNNGGDIAPPTGGGGSGELKSLTMFDAMSMSFDVGGSTSSDSTSSGPAALVEAWNFVLDTYRRGSPALA